MTSVSTYCFGRYLVDIPNGAILEGSGNEYIGTEIKVGKLSRDLFQKDILNKKLELTTGKGKRDLKLAEELFSTDDDKRLFVGVKELYGSVGYSIDTYKHTINGYMFKTSGDAFGEKYIKKTIERYSLYLGQVSYRSSNDIPKNTGFCFENGFVANDGKISQKEQANLYFRLKKNHDISIRINSEVNFISEPSLLERLKDSSIRKQLAGKYNSIREDKRDVGELQGEESLVKFPLDDKIGPAYLFVWESAYEVNNPLRAQVRLEIRGGDGAGGGITIPSTLSEKEIRALYEQVVKSIRVRPTI